MAYIQFPVGAYIENYGDASNLIFLVLCVSLQFFKLLRVENLVQHSFTIIISDVQAIVNHNTTYK